MQDQSSISITSTEFKRYLSQLPPEERAEIIKYLLGGQGFTVSFSESGSCAEVCGNLENFGLEDIPLLLRAIAEKLEQEFGV